MPLGTSSARTQAVNRLHVLLTHLNPAGLTGNLTADADADTAAALLRTVRPRELLARTHRQVAVDLVAEVRRLDWRITTADAAIKDAIAASGSTLTGLYGVGDIVAATMLARAGTADRFPSAAHVASFAGVAPIEVSSGDVVRHRLCRAGDRQLNRALHVMAITQIRGDTDGKIYYRRKRQAGKLAKQSQLPSNLHQSATGSNPSEKSGEPQGDGPRSPAGTGDHFRQSRGYTTLLRSARQSPSSVNHRKLPCV